MSHRSISPHITTLHLTSLHFTSHHSTSHHSTSHHSISPHIPTLHLTSLHFTSHHYTSSHITPLHITSFHFTSLHFPSLHFTALLDNFFHTSIPFISTFARRGCEKRTESWIKTAGLPGETGNTDLPIGSRRAVELPVTLCGVFRIAATKLFKSWDSKRHIWSVSKYEETETAAL